MKIYRDERYLKSSDDIEGYFKAEGFDILECGQGDYDDEAVVYCQTGTDTYYKVEIEGHIGSAKTARGDRLYWVDSITRVDYSVIDEGELIDIRNARLKDRMEELYEEINKIEAEMDKPL